MIPFTRDANWFVSLIVCSPSDEVTEISHIELETGDLPRLIKSLISETFLKCKFQGIIHGRNSINFLQTTVIFLVVHHGIGSAVSSPILRFEHVCHFQPFDVFVFQLVFLDHIVEVDFDTLVFVGNVVCADEFFFVEVISQSSGVMGVEGIQDIGLDLPLSDVLVQHQLQLRLILEFKFGVGIIESNWVGDGQWRYIFRIPLKIAIFDQEPLDEICGVINKDAPSRGSCLTIFVVLFDVVAEAECKFDGSQGNVDMLLICVRGDNYPHRFPSGGVRCSRAGGAS